MENLKPYTTIAPDGLGESLYEDRKSQFFGFAIHAETADGAIAFRHSIIERIPNASHYVSAWILADGTEFFSDAKEPHGTAGIPVLNAIKGRGFADTACVVARVFGGTLLGKGGLMRAYTKAAGDALDAARTVLRAPCKLVDATVPYPLYDPLSKQIVNWGAHVDGADFAADVTIHLSVRREDVHALVERIRDFTNAAATCALGHEELRYLDH